MSIEHAGKIIDHIDVKISHKIINLFSAGLYSSPNKAFEELVCNSYDALASNVAVYIPPDLADNNSAIWVCDNGEGMDQKELKNLWLIGDSEKRNSGKDKQRLQIGRFGIGKLATYVLTNQITYISKKKNYFLAVTMDYRKIDEDDKSESFKLNERVLTENEAQELLDPYVVKKGVKMLPFELFGENASESWTFSIMTDLKPRAHDIQEGRLQWILSTALPLSPGFKLFFNGNPLESSKITRPISKTWIFGKEDTVVCNNENISSREEDGNYYVDLPNLSGVTGRVELYEDSLLSGKSELLGRSHGIFLMIRGRLVNIDDPLLGMPAFTHGVFNRSRIIVNADELDDYITSTRETIKESLPLKSLRTYITKKFNEVKVYYFTEQAKISDSKSNAHRMAQTSLLVSRQPLLTFVERFFKNEISNPILIEKPDLKEKDNLIAKLKKSITDGDPSIRTVEWGATGSIDDPIAKLNLTTEVITINLLHPFISNYIDSYKDPTPLQNIAVTEALTEAHLYDISLDEETAYTIMKRRDNTLRQLSLSEKLGAPTVAQLLRDSLSDPDALEDSTCKAFSSLGFEVTPIGGNGKPDGIAQAILGSDKNNKSLDFSLTFDAKSTKHKKIKSGTTKLSTIKLHQTTYKATFSVVVSVNFEGYEDENSNISRETKIQKVTAIRAVDLARLVLLCAPKQIGLNKIKNLFETCCTPKEVCEWINNVEKSTPLKPPFDEIIDVVYEKQKTDCHSLHISAIREKLKEKTGNYNTAEEIKDWIKQLSSIMPNFIVIEQDIVNIQQNPNVMKATVSRVMSQVPENMSQIYLDFFSGISIDKMPQA